jgi:hypothetical protein
MTVDISDASTSAALTKTFDIMLSVVLLKNMEKNFFFVDTFTK